MAGLRAFPEFYVTPEKVEEAVRRIVEHANPLQIIAFGSRARGDHREDSDLDLAVILDGREDGVYRQVPYTLFDDIDMELDLIVVSKGYFEDRSPWLNSIFNYIHREGVVLYDRSDPQRRNSEALHFGSGRQFSSSVSAA